MENCCEKVLWRSVVVTCCREVLGKSVVGKCACVWGSVDCRGVLKECCEGVLWKSGEVL